MTFSPFRSKTGASPRSAPGSWSKRGLACACLGPLFLLVAGCGPSKPVDEIAVDTAWASSLATTPGPPDASPMDCPWWCGPERNGTTRRSDPDAPWRLPKTELWSRAVPGRGHATPVVWERQVFVATADEDAHTMGLLCLSLDDGTVRWNRTLHEGGFMHVHGKNSHASSTPACDGRRVFTTFMVEQERQQGIWVSAVDLDGELLWQKMAGPFGSKHGYGSSPLLYKSLVIIVGDSDAGGFLTALDAATGSVRWRVRRPNEHSFGTPILRTSAGIDQVVVPGSGQVVAYDPATGNTLWSVDGPARSCANTVAWEDGMVFASGGYPEKRVLGISISHDGNTATIAWEGTRNICYVPSMLAHDGRLYSINDEGIATCYDQRSGEVVWRERLDGSFSASPVLVGDVLVVPSEDGVVQALRAADEFELVDQLRLNGSVFASPVVLDDRMLIRTGDRVVCLTGPADPKPASPASP